MVIVLTHENLVFEYMAPWVRARRRYVLDRANKVGVLEDGTVYDDLRRFAFAGNGSGDLIARLRSEGWVDPELDSYAGGRSDE